MTTITIFSDTLGCNTPSNNDRFIRFLNACAEYIGADIQFKWTDKLSGYNPKITDKFTNYVWDSGCWYGKGKFRQSDISAMASVLQECINA